MMNYSVVQTQNGVLIHVSDFPHPFEFSYNLNALHKEGYDSWCKFVSADGIKSEVSNIKESSKVLQINDQYIIQQFLLCLARIVNIVNGWIRQHKQDGAK